MLSGTFLMVRCFRMQSHLFKCQANIAPDIFAAILRRKSAVPGTVMWHSGWITMLISLKQIKFTFGSYKTAVSSLFNCIHTSSKELTCLALKSSAIRIHNTAIESDYPPLLRPPR